MGRIQSDVGLITGTKISDTIDALLKISARPRDRLATQVESLKGEQVLITELTALVVGVQLQSSRLGTATNLSGITVASSDTSIVTARSSGTPALGSVRVQSIRTASTSAQISGSFDSAATDLSAGTVTLRTGGFLNRATDLDQLRGGAGVERGRIEVVSRDGNSRIVDLRSALTLDDVAAAINEAEGLAIEASVENDRLVLADTSGAVSGSVVVREVGSGTTAASLGLTNLASGAARVLGDDLAYLSERTDLGSLRDGRSVELSGTNDLTVDLADGTQFTIDVAAVGAERPKRLGDLVKTINEQSQGKLQVRIAANGDSLELADLTAGGVATAATGALADAFGWAGKTAAAGVVAGGRIQSPASGTLLSSLAGGAGLGELGRIDLIARDGTSASVDLAATRTVDDIIRTINGSGSTVTASLNRAGTGITLRDSSSGSGNLRIIDADASNSATRLRIASNVAASSVDSGPLDMQFVSRATKLAALNQGRGVQPGHITLRDAAGKESRLTISVAPDQTVGDLLDRINALPVDLEARLNETGDGFLLIDRSGGAGTASASSVSGVSTAADLGLTGTAKTLTVSGQSQKVIESRQNRTLEVAAGESVEDFVKRVNDDSGLPLTATLLRTGGGVRVIFTSRSSGQAGRIAVDGQAVGLEVTTTSVGADALAAVGGSDGYAGTLVRSDTNEFADVLSGMTFELQGVDADPVTLTVDRSYTKAQSAVKLLVEQYNKVIDKLDAEDDYDPITNTTGRLFGSTEALRIRSGLSAFVNTRSQGSVSSLASLGVKLNDQGKLEFDEAKLKSAIDDDPLAVEKFLAAEDTGLAAKTKKIFENLVGVDNSLLVGRGESLQRRIEATTERIGNLNLRLSRERARLFKQFTGMEAAIAKIQNNFSGLDLSIFDYVRNNK